MHQILCVLFALFAAIPAFGQGVVPIDRVEPLLPNEFARFCDSLSDWEKKDPLFVVIKNDTQSCLVPSWDDYSDTTMVANLMSFPTPQGVVAQRVSSVIGTSGGYVSCIPAGKSACAFAPHVGARISASGYGAPMGQKEILAPVNGIQMLLNGTYTLTAAGAVLKPAPLTIRCESATTPVGRTYDQTMEVVRFNGARCTRLQ